MNTDRLSLRPKEAAKSLGICERTLWQLTKDGKIPCVRVGTGERKMALYPRTVLETWLAQQAEVQQAEVEEGGDAWRAVSLEPRMPPIEHCKTW